MPMSKAQSLRLVERLVNAFPSARGFTIESQMAYARELIDLDHGAALEAVSDLIATEDRLPSIAAIRKRASGAPELKREESGWAEGWGQVKAAIGRFGRNRQPVLEDKIAERAILLMGWKEFCDSPTSQDGTWRAQFRDMYNQLREQRIERGAIADHDRQIDAPAEARRLVSNFAKQLTRGKES